MFGEKKNIGARLRDALSPKPTRERIDLAIHRLSIQLRRIESSSAQMQARDKALYAKCVSAIKNNQPEMARMYAEECTEIRKLARIALNSQFALERVVLRLDAVKEFGDIAQMMSPLGGVIRTVRSGLGTAMPEISLQLGEVEQSLGDMVHDIGGVTTECGGGGVISEDGQKIMREAATLAEQKVKDKFPDLPFVQSSESSIRPDTGGL